MSRIRFPWSTLLLFWSFSPPRVLGKDYFEFRVPLAIVVGVGNLNIEERVLAWCPESVCTLKYVFWLLTRVLMKAHPFGLLCRGLQIVLSVFAICRASLRCLVSSLIKACSALTILGWWRLMSRVVYVASLPPMRPVATWRGPTIIRQFQEFYVLPK